jgi:glycosyltransferase involved in cell wall biosynthesis
MRIGIEGQRLFRKEKHGMDIVAMEIIKALQLIDSENEYFIFVKDGEDDEWFEPTKNFHIIRLKKHSYHIWEQFILPNAVHKHKIDILHCTSNTAPMFVNVPLVLTLHDIIYLENFKFISYKSTVYQLIGNFYRRWVVPRILNTSEIIVTVSNTEKSTIIQKYPELADKVKVVYNSYGEFFKYPPLQKESEIIAKYNLPEKYIFCLGNQSPKKNLSNILKGYFLYLEKAEEKIPMVFADHSPGDIFLLLNSASSKYRPYLRFIGYVGNNEIPIIYKNSELFLYPSIRESFGIPLLEAMAMKTPVLTSNISCMPEIAGRSAFLANPFDPQSIANGIEALLTNQKLRNTLIERGLQRIKIFSWENSAKQMIEIYTNIFQRKYTAKNKKGH